MLAGLARNQKIGVYAASAVRKTLDRVTPSSPELHGDATPELLQLGQAYHKTDLEVTLVPALVVYPFRLKFV